MPARFVARLLAPLLMFILAAPRCEGDVSAARRPCRGKARQCQPVTTTTTLPAETGATSEATSTTLQPEPVAPPTTEAPTTSFESTSTSFESTTSTDEPSTTTTMVVPTTSPPTTVTAETVRSTPPPLAQVGPRGPLIVSGATRLDPGTYAGLQFGRITPTSAGTYTFVDSELAGFEAFYPGVRLVLDHSRVNSGLWFDGGSHDGAEIRWSVIDGGPRQALRPKGPGTLTVEDSWLLTHDTELDPNIHTETVQLLDGAAIAATRTAFSCQPRWASWGTPVTAVANLSEGGASVLTDVIFGYWDGAGWSAGGGYYAVYAGSTSRFVRPTIFHPSPWYPPAPTGDRLIEPAYS